MSCRAARGIRIPWRSLHRCPRSIRSRGTSIPSFEGTINTRAPASQVRAPGSDSTENYAPRKRILFPTSGPIEARKHGRDARRDILLNHLFARSGADDAADEIADTDRHLPPALLPGPDATRRPRFRILAQ